MRLTQGCFSYLPDLTEAQIKKQVEYFKENTWISYSNQCFRGFGVLYEYIIHGL